MSSMIDRLINKMKNLIYKQKDVYDSELYDLIPKNQYEYIPKGEYVFGPTDKFLLVPKNRYKIQLLPGQERKSDCGIGWLTEDNSPEGYDMLWGDPNALEQFRTEGDGVRDKLAKEIVSHVIEMIPRECTIIDVGCGVGDLLNEIKFHRPAAKMYGCDFSIKAIDAAQLSIPEGVFTCEIIGTRLNYMDSFFDVVLCTDVLEHLDYPKNIVGELLRICKHGGFVALVVPDGDVDQFLGHNWFWNLEQFTEYLKDWKPVVTQMPETKEILAIISK